MRKLFKISICCVCILVLCFSGAAFYGLFMVPDEAFTHGNSVTFHGIYYAQTDNNLPCSGKTVSVSAELKLMNLIPIKKITINSAERRQVSIGGELIGIKLNTEGLAVAGTESFESANGNVSPAEKAGIRPGDFILTANGKKLENNKDFTEILNNSNGSKLELTLKRNGNTFQVSLQPEKSSSTGMFKAGLWIRDSVGGIGTLTYSDTENGTLGALGHGIYDMDTGTVLSSSGGYITSAELSGVTPGAVGTAGQLCGTAGDKIYGILQTNNEKGIYGLLNTIISPSGIYPVAEPEEVHTGPAQILCTVSDKGKQVYDIMIEKTSHSGTDGKDMVIKITDTSLLGLTGGIVRGMSGSPIIQDGMFVGAVTHVFINDPTKGYGIYATQMLSQSDRIVIQDNLAA